MARPPKHPADVKLKIVLSVLQGESTQAEAARRHGVSETSIGKWKEQFVAAGRAGLERAGPGRASGEQARLEAQVDDLTHALGEAHGKARPRTPRSPARCSPTWSIAAWIPTRRSCADVRRHGVGKVRDSEMKRKRH